MKIRVFTTGGKVYYCILHFVVIEENGIVACSFTGNTGNVERVFRSIKDERPIDIVIERRNARRFIPLPGDYQCISTKIDEGISHGIFIHESCFLSRNNHHIVISPDGSMKAVSRFFMENYALPEEWEDKYPEIFAGHIKELTVKHNTQFPKWANLKAYSIDISEDQVVDTLTRLLQNGELKISQDRKSRGSFEPGWDLRKYLKHNAQDIANEIEKLKPYHDNTDPNRKLEKEIAIMSRIPLPAQADVVQAVYNRLQKANYAFVNGEMGTGKSIIFNALVNVWHHKINKGKYTPVLITAPSSVIPKWIKEEIERDLIGAKIKVINSTEDALRFAREDHSKKHGIEFVFLGIDRAKLGPITWAGSAIWKRIRNTKRYAWHCPDCGNVLNDPEQKDDDGNPIPARWEVMAEGEPIKDRKRILWRQNSKLVKCQNCNTKLWRPATRQAGDLGAKKPRWYISRIFQKKLRKFFCLYGADEIHKQKTQSQKGEAFGKLVRSAQKVVGLTGTLTNGMSTAVKELLWHVAPNELLTRGFDYNTGTIRWANNYGAVESRRREYIRDGNTIRRTTRVTERPGISPRLTVEYLLGCTAFLELKDLGFPLVEKKEIPIFIEMDPEHKEQYNRFHNRLNEFAGRIRGGNVVPAVINYADTPAYGAKVEIKWRYRDNMEERTITAPKLPGLSAKERKLIEIVEDNLKEDRGVIIFTFYTGKYNTNKRLEKILSDRGINAVVLPSSLSPDKRVNWLEKAAEEDKKVIITNLNLIGEGLDLLPWPSLIFYQLSYNVDSVRQAGGRAWRIGQTRECRNYGSSLF